MASTTEAKVVLTAEDKATKKVKAINAEIGKLGKSMVKFGAVAAAAGVAAAGVFIKKSIDAAIDEEVAMTKVNAILRTLKGSFEDNEKVVQDAAKAAMQLGFDDEDASIAMAKLLQVTGNTTTAQKAMTVAMDLARFKSIDLTEAQTAITMALGGNARMLKQLGIAVPEHASKEQMLGLVLDKVKGQAEAYGNTLKGAQDKAKVAFENLQETVGKVFLPVMTKLFTSIANWLNSDRTQAWLRSVGEIIRNNVFPAFQKIGNFISNVLVPIFREQIVPAWNRAYEAIKPHIPLLMDVAKWLGIIAGSAILGGIIFLSNTVSILAGIFGGILQSIKDIVDWLGKMKDKLPRFTSESPVEWFKRILGKAGGGFVASGTPYLVGEKGPELFVPSRSGTIVPNDKMGGSITVNFNNPIVRNDSDLQTIVNTVKRTLTRDLSLERLRV